MSTLQPRRSVAVLPRFRPVIAKSANLLVTIASLNSGRWTVASSDGRFGGTFLSRRAACAFARAEAMAQCANVTMVVCGDAA
jgi:hypothetical protein